MLASKKKNSADDRYYNNQLSYYENKNIAARNEIIDFMSSGIKFQAIRDASSEIPFFGRSYLNLTQAPYQFKRPIPRYLGDPYDVRSLNKYSNKFMDLPVGSHQKIMADFEANPNYIKEFSLAYINGIPSELPSVREKIETLIAKSHILDRRKQVIRIMLNHFDEKDFISFVSIAPLQIEGIFADICKDIGISERQLDISSLNDKLQHIDEKIQSVFYFEYYSFKFPVLRNLVAHGGLIDGELEDTAIDLMLDLLPVCNLAASKELPVNYARTIIESAAKKDFAKLIEWLDIRDKVTIPDFYKMQEEIKAIESLYSSQDFWDYLESEIKRLNDETNIKTCTPIKVAGKLKAKGFAREKCEHFLKNAPKIAKESIRKRKEKSDALMRRLGIQPRN